MLKSVGDLSSVRYSIDVHSRECPLRETIVLHKSELGGGGSIDAFLNIVGLISVTNGIPRPLPPVLMLENIPCCDIIMCGRHLPPSMIMQPVTYTPSLKFPHPALSNIPPPPSFRVIYHELVLTTKEYMRETNSVDPKWLVEFAPVFFRFSDPTQLSKRKRQERIEPLYNR